MSVNYLRGTEINEKWEIEKLIKVLLMFSCSKVTLVYPTLPTLLVLIVLGSSRSKYQWKRFLFQNFWHLCHQIKWQKTLFFRPKQLFICIAGLSLWLTWDKSNKGIRPNADQRLRGNMLCEGTKLRVLCFLKLFAVSPEVKSEFR